MIFRILAYVFLLGSVSWADVPAPPASGVSTPPELRLLRACMEKSGGGIVISPFSLYEVLRYLLPGAAGETGNQIKAVLPGDGRIRKDWTFLSEDFSRLGSCVSEPLKIHDVYRECAVRVREEGLDASASTAGEMNPFSGPPPRGKGPEIEFNRPFLWLIYSPEDRAVLFMGTYEGPEYGRRKGTS